jgi:diacylglycerol kinase
MKSFVCAACGIWLAVKTERNIRIHIAAVFYVVIIGILVGFHSGDWALIALACGLVIGAELLNTAMEHLCDGLEPGNSSVVKNVKDLTAGAVLVCAAAAAVMFVAVLWWFVEWNELPEVWVRPAFWVGLGAAPFWAAFVFWFGKGRVR